MKRKSPKMPRVPEEGVKLLRRHLAVPARKQKKLEEIRRREIRKPF